MGASKSRQATAGGVIEGDVRALQRKRRQQVAQEFQRLDKEERRRQTAAVQMASLPAPAAPFVPKRVAEASTLQQQQPQQQPPRLPQVDYDAEAKRRMQDQLAWDSQTFVLNQVLLSVQFFENYEREMWQAMQLNRQHETRQTRLIERHCKVVLLPDRLQEAVDRRIKYRPRHGLHKHTDRPLHPQTMYIVHENIEVTNAGERSNYSILTDAPIYKLEIDTTPPPSGQRPHIGYVRLRCVEGGLHIHADDSASTAAAQTSPALAAEDSTSSSDDEAQESSGAGLSDGVHVSAAATPRAYSRHRDSIIMLGSAAAARRRREQRASAQMTASLTQTSSSSSAEYDYAVVSALNVRKPLSAAVSETTTDGALLSATQLPESCFTHHAEPEASNEEDETDDPDADNPPPRQIHQYLNSKAFLTHFVAVFRDRLAADIGITAAHLNTATWKGACISAQPWNIVPALSCPWPNEAFEWMHRQRDIKQHPVTLQRFQWPTPDMVNKVVSFGCLAVPIGYQARPGSGAAASMGTTAAASELEWRVCFPNAERYLEGCLTAAQCKVYVVAKALLQTFVEPFVEGGWLGAEHLRAHLFWQCEHNYAAWPEEYLGEALVRFLNSLLEHIKRQRLPDYFLPKRNLFENVPERVMVDLHKRIFRITENPVMYTMIALRNLRWLETTTSEPMVHLDLKTLYGIMTVDNPLKMVNPNFRRDEDEGNEMDEEDNGADADGPGAMGAIGYHLKVARDGKAKRRKTRKVRFAEAEKVQEEAQAAARRASQESIDVRFPIVRHMEQLRRVLIYELFVAHYMQMARAAMPHRAHNQALIYLKQATRLCQLLADDDRGEQAASLASCIETLQQVVLNERARDADAKPRLPQRESVRSAVVVEPVVVEGRQQRAAASTVSRVRVAPVLRSNGAYTNLAAMDAVQQRVVVEEVRRPQTPIGAHSFFDEEPEEDNEPKVALVLGGKGQFELRTNLRRMSEDSEDVTAL